MQKKEKIISPDDNTIILSDYTYWGNPKIYNSLVKYCNENNIFLQGLLLVFPDTETKISFILRWA